MKSLIAAILLKAYAKLNRCYEFLNGGLTADALIDLCGGVEESFEVNRMQKHDYDRFWRLMTKAHKFNSMIGCHMIITTARGESKLANGLVGNHAYAITKVHEIKSQNQYHDQFKYFHGTRGGGSNNVRLVRLRNPWGNHDEWNGPYSDFSREWDLVSEKEKREIGLVRDYDGEFWFFNLLFFSLILGK